MQWDAAELRLPPPDRVNCVLGLVSALLGCSFRTLGIINDALVVANPPLVTYAELLGMTGV